MPFVCHVSILRQKDRRTAAAQSTELSISLSRSFKSIPPHHLVDRNVQREPSGDRLRLHVGRHVHGMDALLIGSDRTHSTKRLANVPHSTSSTSAILHRLLDTAAARTLPPD